MYRDKERERKRDRKRERERGINTFALSLDVNFCKVAKGKKKKKHTTPAVSKLGNTGKMYFGDYVYHPCVEKLPVWRHC